ncbi:hypothetical protein BKA66DRAFT_571425 [Pyrenochaeta sp. MPI-SDFR-AT-0127]|nr:hypothetical protein BKA66DRAFT_571425 [Pyrenochaeta sp. MPI-SDFR-AT-0127]
MARNPFKRPTCAQRLYDRLSIGRKINILKKVQGNFVAAEDYFTTTIPSFLQGWPNAYNMELRIIVAVIRQQHTDIVVDYANTPSLTVVDDNLLVSWHNLMQYIYNFHIEEYEDHKRVNDIVGDLEYLNKRRLRHETSRYWSIVRRLRAVVRKLTLRKGGTVGGTPDTRA